MMFINQRFRTNQIRERPEPFQTGNETVSKYVVHLKDEYKMLLRPHKQK